MNIPANYLEMPDAVPGFSVYDLTREYVIVINKNLNKDEQQRVYNEELTKIINGLYVNEVLRCVY